MPENQKKIERLQIDITSAELKAIGDFQLEASCPSRAAAVRELIRRGLAHRTSSKQGGEPKPPPQSN